MSAGELPAAPPWRPDPTAAGRRLRIGVIGAGAAGLTAAHLLQRRHEVVLFDKDTRPGGHVRTVVLDGGPDAGTAIDTGFIVYNDRNYPRFRRLLGELGVTSRISDMSFGYHDENGGLQYCGSGLNGLFAQRRNALRPGFWRFLRGIVQFAAAARAGLSDGSLGTQTLSEFLDRCGCREPVAAHFVLPLAAAIWSGSRSEVGAFPAAPLLRFFDNHGLLALRDRPRWKTIVGGSHVWVRELLRRFTGHVRCGQAVATVLRHEDGAIVRLADGASIDVDRVVFATHADQTLRLLADPSDLERRLLGAWRYNTSDAVLHSDPAFMPPSPRAWASWNYRRRRGSGDDDPVAVTYWMNRLHGLDTRRPYFVTLNPDRPPAPDLVVTRTRFAHPVYDQEALATQALLRRLNGRRGTFYCGSYLGYGFHEDAVRSGAEVARAVGIDAISAEPAVSAAAPSPTACVR